MPSNTPDYILAAVAEYAKATNRPFTIKTTGTPITAAMLADNIHTIHAMAEDFEALHALMHILHHAAAEGHDATVTSDEPARAPSPPRREEARAIGFAPWKRGDDTIN